MFGSAVGSRLGGRLLWLPLVAVVWLAVVGGGCARATTGHTFAGEFGGVGVGDGQFAEPNSRGPAGVGVMASSGEVFTVDQGQGSDLAIPRVQRFSADGAFASAFALGSPYNSPSAIAVDSSGSGSVYVSTNSEPSPLAAVVKYSAAGVFAYELNASTSGTTINNAVLGQSSALAVDPVDGTVYVTATDDATGLPVIDRFDGSTGAFKDSFDGSNGSDGFQCPTGLAVDGSHRVYVLDSCSGLGKNRVDRFGADGAFQATTDDGLSRGTPLAVAVDPVSDEVYVAETGPVGVQITQFSAGGADVLYTFDGSNVDGVRSMAVSGAGAVYTSDATRPFVERFTRFDGPTVETGPVSSFDARSAVLEGTINPEGVVSRYHFEYGTDLTYGKRSPAVGDTGAGSGSVGVPAIAAISGLEPNKLYHYRLVGSNDSGSIVGADQSFTTSVAPPGIGEAFASAISPRSVRLHGTINPFNSFTPWHFEYGTTTAYGTTGPDGFLGAVGTDQAVVSEFAGLEPDTTYHFRLVSPNFSGGASTVSPDQTFVTAPAAGGGASDVTAGRATLTGTINPHGVSTSYHFNYGPTSNYGASTPEVDGGSGNGEQPASAAVSGLLPDRTYHVRVVATSANGVVRTGGDGVFRTAPAPTAEVIGPTGVSTDAATLAGDVNTFGVAGSYHFEVWSLNSAYTHSTPELGVAGNATAERVEAGLTGLPAGETFVVQLAVSSNDAVRVSDLLTFATAEAPKLFPTSPTGDGTSLYGCGSPRLDPYNSRPKPGEMITISGRDLGVGGSVMLGDRSLTPVDWSATQFKVMVPRDAAGSLALTVNCGRRSNTIAVAVFREPDNGFSVVGRSVAGSTATLRVRVSGPGKLESFGAGTQATNVTIKKPGTATIKVKLTSAGARALRRAASRPRRVGVRVRFTPAGGRSGSKTVTITFKRKGAR